MKQHITVEQLNELSDKGKERLRKWWIKPFAHQPNKDFYQGTEYIDNKYPLLSIGQMIEFLGEEIGNINKINGGWGIDRDIKGSIYVWTGSPELADALWEACKEVLSSSSKE